MLTRLTPLRTQIPSLVNRLATLHASLTSRLALQPTLLALNGRLELVMSQIDLRQERAAQRAELAAALPKSSRAGRKYVEGESDESGSEDEGEMDDDEEFDDDEGSVEDVVLGSGDEEEMGSDEEIDDGGMGFEDDEDDSEAEGRPQQANGRGVKIGAASLLDLEASEDDSESDAQSDEESDEDSD